MLCVIGGSGLEKLFEDSEEFEINTPYGTVVAYRVKFPDGKEFSLFLVTARDMMFHRTG